jgi:hypothetical protein
MLPTVVALAMFTSCGNASSISSDTTGPDSATAVSATTAPESTSTTTEQQVASTVVTTTIVATTVAMTSLPAVEILSVSTGAGSGELVVTVDRVPAGFTRFKVSLDGPNGPSMRARILDVAASGNGTAAITIFAPDYGGGEPITFAVSWVDGAGVTSALDYHRCNTWPSLMGSTC